MSEKFYKASDVIDILLDELSHMDYLKVIQRLAQVPSAIVRCKDCAHWKENDNLPEHYGRCEECVFGYCMPRENFFCKNGERRSKCD